MEKNDSWKLSSSSSALGVSSLCKWKHSTMKQPWKCFVSEFSVLDKVGEGPVLRQGLLNGHHPLKKNTSFWANPPLKTSPPWPWQLQDLCLWPAWSINKAGSVTASHCLAFGGVLGCCSLGCCSLGTAFSKGIASLLKSKMRLAQTKKRSKCSARKIRPGPSASLEQVQHSEEPYHASRRWRKIF